MKKIFVFAIQLLVCLILSVTNLYAYATNACDCSAFSSNQNLGAAEKLRSNLSIGFWIKKSEQSKQQSYIQFHQSGRLDWVLSSKKEGTTFLYDGWKLSYTEEMPVLILKNSITEVSQNFDLERICEGMILTNKTTKVQFMLKHQCQNQTAIVKSAVIGLAGNWDNATYPFDLTKKNNSTGTRKAMKGAFLKVSFQLDGTYLKKYGNEEISLIEKGTWEISEDGQFVFLHNQNKTSIAKIQHLDLDEMVLEWQLEHPGNTDFSTAQKSFVFIR